MMHPKTKKACELVPLSDRVWMPDRSASPDTQLVIGLLYKPLYPATVLSSELFSNGQYKIKTICGTAYVSHDFVFHLVDDADSTLNQIPMKPYERSQTIGGFSID
jgi:hypothetical protein